MAVGVAGNSSASKSTPRWRPATSAAVELACPGRRHSLPFRRVGATQAAVYEPVSGIMDPSTKMCRWAPSLLWRREAAVS